MRTRRIAVAGLADDASQAFRSMLKILEGRGGLSWILAPPDAAEVLIAGTHGDELIARRWARTDKPVIAVYEGSAARPMTPYTLHHPFRVMQLLGVLEEIDQALARPMASTPRTHVAESGTGFAESLRLLARGNAAGGLYAAGEGGMKIFVRSEVLVYYASTETAQRLTRSALPFSALHLTNESPPPDFVCRPIFELAWFTGWHASTTLASWVDPGAVYHLQRWPDFGLLRGSREQLALAALLTRASHSRSRLIELSQQSESSVDRFLNACALAGVLTVTANAAGDATGSFMGSSAARLGGLIRGLRSRLGLTN
ncbi:MAG: hypothetical protein JNN30_02075 [Rhodanobacteraceae bacterium]|nr:hypothetical protein [Rhodanobacteraceae bacterium]